MQTFYSACETRMLHIVAFIYMCHSASIRKCIRIDEKCIYKGICSISSNKIGNQNRNQHLSCHKFMPNLPPSNEYVNFTPTQMAPGNWLIFYSFSGIVASYRDFAPFATCKGLIGSNMR